VRQPRAGAVSIEAAASDQDEPELMSSCQLSCYTTGRIAADWRL